MMKEIKVSTNNIKKINENWRYCIGTGRLSLALRKEYLDALRTVQKEIGFKYIRGHGLLCDDIGIYREYEWKGKTKVLYNFTYIDQIFDSFLELNIKPFVELGFMPKQLSSSDETVFWWEGNITPPKDYEKWRQLIFNLVTHFIERYGLVEVLSWPFEVWNEPNLSKFWKDANMEAYFKLYQETATVIKRIHSDIQVGGPAICGGSDYWLKEFLDFCEREAVPVDFLSRHAYTSLQGEEIPFGVYQDLQPSESLLKDFKSGREYLSHSNQPNLPVHITEFNTSYKPVNQIHDTAYNATYLAKVISQGGEWVDSFSYWTFSDVFEEEDIPKSLFHGGFGLLAYYQIKKPTYYLYQFFAKLSGPVLYRDDQTHVVQKTDGNLAFIAWNESAEKGAGHEKAVKITLPIVGKQVFLKRTVVSEQYGNAWGCWRQLGRPRFPSREQIEIIRDASMPKIETETFKVVNNELTIEYSLTKNELSLFEFYVITEEKQIYEGWDDTKLISY